MIEVIKTDINNSKEWSDFLKADYNLFFDPIFISYNDVFNKGLLLHHLIFKEKNKVLAILNGCEINNKTGKTYVSCNGVSFGGFIWRDKLDVLDYIKVLNLFKNYLREQNFEHCIIRNPPCVYPKNFNEEYDYALISQGFQIRSFSITNIINLNDFDFNKLPNPKKRAIQKSEKIIDIKFIENNVTVENLTHWYNILLKNREQKGVKPTHTLEELVYLKNHLPDKIIFLYATVEGTICGVCILFTVKTDVILNFYLAADIKFKKYRVSDFLLYKSIEWSKQNNFRLYDIGTSNVGNTILEGLFDFKKKFLANGFLRMVFEINLKDYNENNQ